jgi:hypothetical protein
LCRVCTSTSHELQLVNSNEVNKSSAAVLAKCRDSFRQCCSISIFTRCGLILGGKAGILITSRSHGLVGGSYPSEQQWRAEGILVSTPAECRLLKHFDSLLYYVACQRQRAIVCDEEEAQGINEQPYGVTARRHDQPAAYTEHVDRLRQEKIPA